MHANDVSLLAVWAEIIEIAVLSISFTPLVCFHRSSTTAHSSRGSREVNVWRAARLLDFFNCTEAAGCVCIMVAHVCTHARTRGDTLLEYSPLPTSHALITWHPSCAWFFRRPFKELGLLPASNRDSSVSDSSAGRYV